MIFVSDSRIASTFSKNLKIFLAISSCTEKVDSLSLLEVPQDQWTRHHLGVHVSHPLPSGPMDPEHRGHPNMTQQINNQTISLPTIPLRYI